MNVAEIERLLRIGMCPPARHAANGCETCDRYEAAVAFVKKLDEDNGVLRAQLGGLTSFLHLSKLVPRPLVQPLAEAEAARADLAEVRAALLAEERDAAWETAEGFRRLYDDAHAALGRLRESQGRSNDG